MVDIVERLRDTTGIHEELIYEAADEIERLREALRNIAMRGPDGELWNTKAEIWMIAEAALQQKDSE